mmetsp:Transcript_20364/g.44102  ORF Transcript_20364/g.44102 Transcript_20364/m.44102 type:complete len:205 (+) Transcript_20364:144-758(+)
MRTQKGATGSRVVHLATVVAHGVERLARHRARQCTGSLFLATVLLAVGRATMQRRREGPPEPRHHHHLLSQLRSLATAPRSRLGPRGESLTVGGDLFVLVLFRRHRNLPRLSHRESRLLLLDVAVPHEVKAPQLGLELLKAAMQGVERRCANGAGFVPFGRPILNVRGFWSFEIDDAKVSHLERAEGVRENVAMLHNVPPALLL